MMPSRGLRLARVYLPQHINQSRNISIASRPFAKPQHEPSVFARRSTWQHERSPLLKSVNGIRLASTTSAGTATEVSNANITSSTAAATNPPASTLPNLDTITLDSIDLERFADVPETVGYLAKIGIDFGYGPTSVLQWILENFHFTAGLPWWASIAATAVTLRIFMFPLNIKASDSVARQAALASITAPIQKRMTAYQQAGDKAMMQQTFQELLAIRKQAGIRFRDQFAPLIFQGVLGFCGFRLIRAMATLPVPGLTTGGFSWLTDLTVTDPYLILPVLMGASMHLVGRMGGESGVGAAGTTGAANAETMRKLMLYILPAGVTLIMGWQPAALAVWFAASGFVAVLQTILFRNSTARKALGIAPMYKPKPEDAKNNNVLSGLLGSQLSAKDNTTTLDSVSRIHGVRYQPPKLQTRNSDGKTIDIKPLNSVAGDSAKEQADRGVFAAMKDKYVSLKQEQAQKRAIKAKQSAVSARKSAAKAYEERYHKMGRQ